MPWEWELIRLGAEGRVQVARPSLGLRSQTNNEVNRNYS